RDCTSRVVRGGSWETFPRYLRSANREPHIAVNRSVRYGFRVARTL
ncbi:MAG: SUMF1/EgtB/PvdO family nonheme iron enzyme, partial [Rhodoplanes sp.]